METEIVKTSNLTPEQVELINKYILPEFDEYIIQPLKYPDSSRFIFLKEEGRIVSFARIFDTKIEFKKKLYQVLGLSMIYSIEKLKGYGKRLINEIKSIADKEEKLLIGNCEPKNKGFYIKCELDLLEDSIERFVYINTRDIAEKNENNSIVLIHDPKKEFINEFEKDSEENVYIFEHWW